MHLRRFRGIVGALALLGAAPEVRAAPVERVVAIVGEEPILLSELRQQASDPVLEGMTLRQVLERMVDERLEARAASRELRVVVTDADARRVYARWSAESVRSLVRIRTIAFHVPHAASPAARMAVSQLAENVAEQAKSGVDFCALVAHYNPNAPLSHSCGSVGAMHKAMVSPELAEVVETLAPGETAPLLSMRSHAGEVLLVVQRSPLAIEATPYALVVPKMLDLARAEATERARAARMRELRRSVGVEIRL
ncbi:MAG: peptidylprolyl isomerase [Labilithrix sp.]|nr:peptidylprolyl isomerase [Labilithrix sp.]